MLPQLGRCFSKQERQRQEKPIFYLACTWKLPANLSLLKLNLYIHDKSKLSQEHPSFLKTNLLCWVRPGLICLQISYVNTALSLEVCSWFCEAKQVNQKWLGDLHAEFFVEIQVASMYLKILNQAGSIKNLPLKEKVAQMKSCGIYQSFSSSALLSLWWNVWKEGCQKHSELISSCWTPSTGCEDPANHHTAYPTGHEELTICSWE